MPPPSSSSFPLSPTHGHIHSHRDHPLLIPVMLCCLPACSFSYFCPPPRSPPTLEGGPSHMSVMPPPSPSSPQNAEQGRRRGSAVGVSSGPPRRPRGRAPPVRKPMGPGEECRTQSPSLGGRRSDTTTTTRGATFIEEVHDAPSSWKSGMSRAGRGGHTTRGASPGSSPW